MAEATTGLNCPRCGGMVPIPEGQTIVRFPFCELRSVVHGERGLRRYQLSCKVDRPQAEEAFRKFLTSSMAIARDVSAKAQLSEAFVAYLPFWMAWGRAMGYALGQQQVGSGEHKHYEPREIRIVEEMTWNTAACDVGEFGVSSVPLDQSRVLEAYQADALHAAGMVFEPVGSPEQAQQMAQTDFENRVRSKGRLDRLSQFFVRITRMRMGLVYYPLWVLRYQYRGRSFQVAVDGTTGQILYGKAPGNTFYRAAVLVGGMLAGAVLSVDVTSLLLYALSNDHNGSDGLLVAVGVVLLAGLGLMYTSFRKFRYGEQYEFRSGPKTNSFAAFQDLARSFNRPDDLLRSVIEGDNPWPRP